MARLHVNPTRMELAKLKKRLTTARRGHKLLKDKRDELMKQFLQLARQNRSLRRSVEARLQEARQTLVTARAHMADGALEEALLLPAVTVTAEVSIRNIMSVRVPSVRCVQHGSDAELYAYGLTETSGELDHATHMLAQLLPQMVELAGVEKSCELLSYEIEKTRRRVNALEHVMIPNLEETIRFIVMKLEENERGSITRLMKVKDMVLAGR